MSRCIMFIVMHHKTMFASATITVVPRDRYAPPRRLSDSRSAPRAGPVAVNVCVCVCVLCCRLSWHRRGVKENELLFGGSPILKQAHVLCGRQGPGSNESFDDSSTDCDVE